jgi:uncharacterized membrane protein
MLVLLARPVVFLGVHCVSILVPRRRSARIADPGEPLAGVRPLD